MATYTPNLNLKKPTGNEHYDVVAEGNDAKDKIDLAIGNHASQLAEKASNTKADEIQTQVNNLVLGAVGDGNNAEVLQARDTEILLNDRFANIENGERLLQYSANKFTNLNVVEGKYLGASGAEVVSTGNCYSDYIPVKLAETYAIIGFPGNVFQLIAYDANKAYIGVIYNTTLIAITGGYKFKAGYENSGGVFVVKSFHSNIKYVRANMYVSDRTKYMFVVGETIPALYVPYSFDIKGNNVKKAIRNLKRGASVISCWGDSKTMGNQDGTGVTFPKVLQTLLNSAGYDYVVNNMGVGGEYTTGIAGRQGGLPLVVQPFTIPAALTAVQVLINSTLDRVGQQGFAGLNPVIINGVEGEIKYDWTNLYNTFKRSIAGSEVVVSRPTQVITDAMRKNRDDILIIDIGTNGGFSSVDEWIKQIRCMIDYSTHNEYLVVGRNVDSTNPVFYNSVVEPEFKKAFGNRYLNLRAYEVAYGLQDVGITPTGADNTAIASGLVPPSLLFDAIHENQYGYTVKAQQVFRKLEDLQIISK